ncbi:SIR2 family protein [Pseudomonas chengduensis]|jgi:NAD-dependent SIR2 family protein deacetylase|nr:SIR2 family protein [Pseudomonas chengduensis]MBG0844546.1 SIR2 family protein [Pseudomonas chengduensis]
MTDVIAEALRKFFHKATDPILFTGAGVSVKAGLPTWKGLIHKLAEGIRPLDPATADMMAKRAEKGDLTTAVDYFMLSDDMNTGDKYKLVASLLEEYDAGAISDVASLPFKGCLTTNFDESILQAIGTAKGKSPRDYKYGDASFKQAQWEEKQFVARIHGAVEHPECIVLSKQHFENLLKDETYLELLRTCFSHRNVLFLGFSFYDPAIRHVFSELDRKFGSSSTGRHMALLPSDIDSEFVQKAHHLNIEVVRYDAKDNHAALWSGLAQFNNAKESPKTGAAKSSPFSFTKQFLATCYARAHAGSSKALRVAVTEGVVSALLQESAPQPIGSAELIEKMRLTLGVNSGEITYLLESALNSLMDSGLCAYQTDGSYSWVGDQEESDLLGIVMERLVESTVSRAFVSEGWDVPENVRVVIGRFFDGIINRRGWDLGVAFSAGRVPEAISVASLMNECAHDIFAFDKERLLRVLQNQFAHPTVEEAEILSELGRLSFAIELAFKSPHSVLLSKAILPRKIYFDASVVLPIIAEGHAYTAPYKQAIAKLREASSSAAVSLKLLVADVYLNEIISHKAKAEAYFREAGDDFKAIAMSDAMYNGSTNTNVFIAGFANWIANNQEITFPEYLARFAPFSNESKLKAWLIKQGFEVVSIPKSTAFSEIYSIMERAYASSLSYGKTPLLIEHDAIQVSVLSSEIEKGEKAIFVTADRQLKNVLANSKYQNSAECMISHIGLIQFIEVMLGGIQQGVGLAQLIWSSKVSERAHAVRSYFTSKALQQYDASMLMTMPEIIDKFADFADAELGKAGENLDIEDPTKRVKAFKALGMLEKQYFENMKVAMKKMDEAE